MIKFHLNVLKIITYFDHKLSLFVYVAAALKTMKPRVWELFKNIVVCVFLQFLRVSHCVQLNRIGCTQ